MERSWRDYIPAAALAFSVAGLLWASAQAFGQLEEHGRRLAALEVESKEEKALQRQNAERLARIEANIEYIARNQK